MSVDGRRILVLWYKCAKCGELWHVEATPPKPEPASCCPRCASFVREFAGREEVRRPADAADPRDRRPAPDAEIAGQHLRVRGGASPTRLDRLH